MGQPPDVSLSPGPDFKDRRTGLVVFGILAIFIGCICVLFVPLMFLGQALSARTAGEPPDYRMVLPSVMAYAVMAVGFVWLGVGSIMARRWARALLLVLAWMWLLLGVFTVGLMAAFLPGMIAASPTGGQPMPGSVRVVITVFVLAFIGVVFAGLPGTFILFYRSRHVKATCEARDPMPRWTDACPLPVLALSLALAFTPLSLVTMLVGYNSVVPFFGRLLTGAPAAALLVLLTAAWGYGAWATYKLKPLGWWIVTVAFVIFSVSAVLTFARVDVVDVYQAMGYSARDVQLMRGVAFIHGQTFAVMMTAIMAPFIGYLFWMKRYFR
jgi:hypothetical protein